MKYRAKINLVINQVTTHITTKECSLHDNADYLLGMIKCNIEQATGGHIEQFVDGIGWVVCEEEGND